MATTAVTVENIGKDCYVAHWTALPASQTGDPVLVTGIGGGSHGDKSVHVAGALGVGGSVTIEGSNQSPDTAVASLTWATIHDPGGSDLTFAAVDRMKQILENVVWIRPNCTAGNGATSFNVHILMTPASKG